MRQRGFTYIGVLFIVLVIGIGLASVGMVWNTQMQREKERELLFAGGEFRRAIRAYTLASPGVQRYPQRLEDLLEDKRFPFTRRYLRRIYRDPMTGKRDWVPVEAPGGGIMGVHSRSEAPTLKRAHFAAADAALEGKARYSEWTFFYQPTAPTAPAAARAAR